MDKIQKFLIEKGREDLANEYYQKYEAKKKKQDEKTTGPSYIKLLGKVRNLKTDSQIADFEERIKGNLKDVWNGFSSDKKVILKRELERKRNRFREQKGKKDK